MRMVTTIMLQPTFGGRLVDVFCPLENFMNSEKCDQCEAMLAKQTSKRHDGLERIGFSRAVGHYGSRDDEHEYTCRTCGARFIGDSCGTWEKKGE